MSTDATAGLQGSATTDASTATDRALTCVDLPLDYAPDTLLIDFEAWTAARECSTTTLRRLVGDA